MALIECNYDELLFWGYGYFISLIYRCSDRNSIRHIVKTASNNQSWLLALIEVTEDAFETLQEKEIVLAMLPSYVS